MEDDNNENEESKVSRFQWHDIYIPAILGAIVGFIFFNLFLKH